jgi:hypothetical protein
VSGEEFTETEGVWSKGAGAATGRTGEVPTIANLLAGRPRFPVTTLPQTKRVPSSTSPERKRLAVWTVTPRLEAAAAEVIRPSVVERMRVRTASLVIFEFIFVSLFGWFGLVATKTRYQRLIRIARGYLKLNEENGF